MSKVKTPPVSLYVGKVMHRRLFPNAYQFVYRVFSLLIDIDQLDGASSQSRLFSVNRFNLVSFYERDHLPHNKTGLRSWASEIFSSFGIDERPHRIRILCFPRILGWVFNPISVWYCENQQGEPIAVICEVNNTFGEKHFYLLNALSSRKQWPITQKHEKQFHVSPFIDMNMLYDFRISGPSEKLSIIIREYENDDLMLVASQTARHRTMTNLSLIIQLVRVPFQTLKVVAAIHWHALLIWAAGTPFYSKPNPPAQQVS